MADTTDALVHERTFSGSDIYVPSLTTVFRPLDGGAVVVDLGSRQSRRLNSTGAIVWQVLGDDLTVDGLAAELADAFGAPVDAVWADLLPMLEGLSFDGFLDEVSSGPQLPLPPAPVAPDGPVRLVTPPCGCLTSVEDLDWVGMFALHVGNEIFTIRTNDLGALEVLRSAFAAVVIDDPLAEGYYSVELSAEPTEAAPLRLWEGNTIVCQTQQTTVLWERLLAVVSRHQASAPGCLRLGMLTAVGPRGAALVPAYGAWRLFERRDELAAAGVLLADGPTDLDPSTGQVHVRSGVAVEAGAAELFATLLPGRALVPGAAPGAVPVVALATPPSDGDPLTRFLGVADVVLPHIEEPLAAGADTVMAALDHLAAAPEVAPPLEAGEFADWLLDVLV